MADVGDIANAVAPGVALTSAILYYNALQARYTVITGRVRELNREARALQPGERLDSVKAQASLMVRRSGVLHRAILAVYGGVALFLITIAELLFMGLVEPRRDLSVFSGFTFALALLSLGAGMALSFTEMVLSNKTIREDYRSTYGEEPGRGDGAGRG